MRTYPDELKAQIIAEWSMGATDRRLAITYDIPRSTIRNWTHGLVQAVVTQEKQSDIDALYTEFVSEALLALRAAARVGQDEAWIRSLGPSAYQWMGTLADKVLAALAAFQSASERDTSTPNP